MAVISDDFSAGTLGETWSFAGPAGTGASFGSGGGEAWLELAVPNGNFDIYKQTKNALRLMQEAPDGDFQVEARFLSAPTVKNQMQGILVEEDADSWIRFDTYFDGSNLRAFAAVTLNGVSSTKFNVVIPGGGAPYLRVTHTGNGWTFAWSTDGGSWTTAGSFTQALDVNAVGPFAGGINSPFVARVDYFENTAAPIVNEDGTIPAVPDLSIGASTPVQNEGDSGTTAYTFTITRSGLGLDGATTVNYAVTGSGASPAGAADFAGGVLPGGQVTFLAGEATRTITVQVAGDTTPEPNEGFTVTLSGPVHGRIVTGTAAAIITNDDAVPPPAGPVVSDDFSAGTLGETWSFAGPAGTGASFGSGGGEAWLELAVPNGNFDIYKQTKNALRLMQEAPDGDFQVEARFLSAPTVKNQMQGILVEEDADSWIRFDTYFDGSNLRAFAAVTLNGVSSTKFNVVIPGGGAPYLRVTHTGNGWTFAWSTDGGSWTTAGSFTQALDVNAVGPFAGGINSPFVARVDYFENTAAPIVNEDGTIPAVPDLSIGASTPVQNEGDSGTTAYTFTITRSGLGLDGATTVNYAVTGSGASPAGAADFAGGVLPGGQVTFLAGEATRTITVQVAGDTTPEPNEGFTVTLSGPVHGRIVTGTAAAIITNDDAVPPPAGPVVSDDFSAGTLGETWSFAGPAGTGASFGSGGGEAWLELAVPNGNFDIYKQTKNALRLMQEAPDGDFQVEARFLSAPTVKNQMQGILVEEDADSWIRFDTYFDGSNLRAFAAVTLNGVSSTKFNVVIPGGGAPYLRVTHTGNGWTFAWSTDGGSWTTAGSFTQALDVNAVGPFAGGINSPFVARVDYFENTAAPIVNEDGTIPAVPDLSIGASTPVQNEGDSGTTAYTFTITRSGLGLDGATTVNYAVTGSGASPAGAADFAGGVLPGGQVTFLAGEATRTITVQVAGDTTPEPNEGFTVTLSGPVHGRIVTGTAAAIITNDDAVPPPAGPVVSDDFSAGTLGETWSFAGPAGTGASFGSGGGEAWLELAVPNGNFDIYGTTKNALRLMQEAPDGDFQVEARFLSAPTVKNQMQGILVEEDADSWIRFDTYFDGSNLRAFAAVTLNGVSSTKFNVVIPGGGAPYLRVTHTGNGWTFAWSTDGGSWTTAGSFTQALDVNAVGPFAGGINSPFVARVDYFENTAAPIVNEDGTIPAVPDLSIGASTPVQNEGDSGTTAYTFTITRSGLGLDGATTVNYAVTGSGASPAGAADFAGGVLPGGQVTFLAGEASRTITVQVAGDTAPEPDEGFTVTLSTPVNGRIVTGGAAATITNDDGVAPVIDVWYGNEQSFGAPGEAQRWVNILGNVELSQVTGLAYSLNGGAFKALSIGPDTRRLQNPGDFNIDIDVALLNGSAVDDVVTIRAQLAGGGVVTRNVVVDYESGHRWNPNYSIDWGAVSDLQDATQVIDGKWNVSAAGLRIAEAGYDRFVAIGDQHWDNYELNLALTMHDLHSVDPRGRDGGVFGFGMNWTGHTDDPISGWQPKSGWNPCELIVYKTTSSGGRFSFFGKSGTYAMNLQEGETYNCTLKVEQVGALAHKYSLKIWDTDNAEPSGWLFTRTISYVTPQTGSLFLLTHYYDVAFGDLTVEEIEGHDIAVATAAGGLLRAVALGAANPGRGETDVLKGAAGADRFLLGEDGFVFYDDGVAGAAGQGDYGVVWDFQKGPDQIQLAGAAGDYVLGASPSGLPGGTAIYHVVPGEANELVGVVANTTGLSLTSSDFVYDTLIV